MWNVTEREAVRNLLTTHNPLRAALEKFCQERAAARNQDCATAMRSNPPQFHSATQYASKAELYEGLLTELERQADKETV